MRKQRTVSGPAALEMYKESSLFLPSGFLYLLESYLAFLKTTFFDEMANLYAPRQFYS